MKAIAATILTAAVGVGMVQFAAPSDAKTTAPVNIIRDAGAERATPDTSGDKVPVKYWHVSKKSQFTAVGYGAPAFPDATSPGPKHRGKNFFGGGPTGTSSTGTQVDSLSGHIRLIKSGKAKFTLAAWLGGYSSQRDYATLTVVWERASGAAVGKATTIGPVTAHARHDVTGMKYRSASGIVPKGARQVLVKLRMVRKDGSYIDGYADNLSLTIVHK